METEVNKLDSKVDNSAEVFKQSSLPEYVSRGLGRTSIIGRTATGSIISAEGRMVEEQMWANRAIINAKKDNISEEGKDNG